MWFERNESSVDNEIGITGEHRQNGLCHPGAHGRRGRTKVSGKSWSHPSLP